MANEAYERAATALAAIGTKGVRIRCAPWSRCQLVICSDRWGCRQNGEDREHRGNLSFTGHWNVSEEKGVVVAKLSIRLYLLVSVSFASSVFVVGSE